ncbi:dicarboxylate/amino acid:cation symporter [Phenylobacterium sp.]|uniref:dicarboxylate/amino acid:cation symporter n=1 Tax=Phenylobacterium sp. TaxID=1871053 RepID=UPI002F410C34
MRHFRVLYVQVLIGIALGLAVGLLWPDVGVKLKPLGDGFVKLIKMAIAPVIFCTVAAGVARMNDLKAFGRLGVRTLLYFEIVSTLALLLGLAVGETVRPGTGFNVDPASLDPSVAASYLEKARHSENLVDYLLGLIPDTFFGALAQGQLLQVLVAAVIIGIACTRLGEFGERVAGFLEDGSRLFFGVIGVVVRLAPIGAFGAMAFTIGKFGPSALVKLGALIATFYATSLLFVVVVLGTVAALAGFSIFRFVAYIREELLIVLGSSSSESALPRLMQKLQALGARRSTVGLVVPTGYSFNLDGTNIYMTLAALFIAQATNVHLSFEQQILLLLVAMLSSKGAAGVTGSGFITLAATLSIVPSVPVAGMALILGVDRFMSECRSLTNFIGNAVATIVVSAWEGGLDRTRLAAAMAGEPLPLSADAVIA